MEAPSPPEFVLLEWLARRPGTFRDDLPVAIDDPTELSRSIETLARLGYDVEAHPVNGFRLRHGVDPVDRVCVQDALQTESFGRLLVCHLQAGSTNDLAWELAESGAPSGTTVTAEYQTAGRGRLGRPWFSPPGSGLWVSVILRPGWTLDRAGLVTLGAGVAVSGAVASFGVDCRLKWPNDVQIRGCKVAGILTESRTEANRISVAVVGIGINVHQEIDTFPPELRDTATSLSIEGCRVERSELLGEILNRMEEVLGLEPAAILRRWEKRATGWGEQVRVETGTETINGRMERLTETGALVLNRCDGSEWTIHAGDVHRLRPV